MAIFVPGMKCPLCGKSITKDQARRLFPPFVKNSHDPLYVFHDATVHEECLLKDARFPTLEVIMSLRERSNRGQKVCVVCRGTIVDVQDLYATGYIASDQKDPLFAYNYLTFHRSHLSQWEPWKDFQRLASERQASDAWRGGAILPPN